MQIICWYIKFLAEESAGLQVRVFNRIYIVEGCTLWLN